MKTDILSNDDMRVLLKNYCTAKKQGDVAKELIISEQYLSLMINGTRAISKKVALHLGYKKTIAYVKSEISDGN